MKRMTRALALLLMAVLVIACLPVAATAEVQYIFPDSSKRHLTWEEVVAWNCEALNIGFNEIWARHGYVFRTGGACWNWFTAQEWYQPITSGTNEKNVLPKASQLEWDNYHLIKDVMAWKRANNQANKGKALPAIPIQFDVLSGFQYVNFKTRQNLAVYSAPSTASWRGANGKASVSTGGRVYAYARENGWLMVMYETNASANAVRVGWIDLSKVKDKVAVTANANFARQTVTLTQTVSVTDDPVAMTPITTLAAGSQVTWLTSFYSGSHIWDYIEFTFNGKLARGFVLSGLLTLEDTDTADWTADAEG